MNIMVVEDSPTTRTMLVDLLDGQGSCKVVAAVESAEEALNYLAYGCVDLVILDLCLPGLSSDLAVKALIAASPGAEILVFTVSGDDEMVFPALMAGATGYILKGCQHMEIVSAIEAIMSGGSPMSPAIARKVLRELQKQPIHEELLEMLSPLSRRETQILDLLYQGSSEKCIADKLCISKHTVHGHIKNIYKKLHVNSRSQALYEIFQKIAITG